MATSKAKPRAIETRRVAIYARKSNIKGMEQSFNSVDAQIAICTEYAASNPGWTIVGSKDYSDGGRSGATLDRPGFQRLMADAKAGKIDTVIVFKIDRVARSVLGFADIKRHFEPLGVEFKFVTENFTDDASGRFLLNMRMSASEYERDLTIERTRIKFATKRKEGLWSGGTVPFGYDSIDKRLVLNKAEAPIVREIFDLYFKLRSAAGVARALRAKGYRTKVRDSKKGPRGGQPWSKASVLLVIRNALYAGLIAHEADYLKGHHEAIISRETFEQAQALLASHTVEAGDTETNPAYFLRGLLTCATITSAGTVCGHALVPGSTRKGGEEYRYYRCGGREKYGRDVCNCSSLAADAIERYIATQLDIASRNIDFMRQLRSLVENAATYAGRLKARRTALAASIATLTTDGENAVDRFSNAGDKARVILERRVNAIASELRSSEAALRRLDTAIVDLGNVKSEARWILDQLDSFKSVWPLLTNENKSRLATAMIDRINVNEQSNQVEILIAPLARRMATVAEAAYSEDSEALALAGPPEGLRVAIECTLFRRKAGVVSYSDKAPVARMPVRQPAKVARMLALAHHTDRAIREGRFPDQATVARFLEMSRARITYLLQLVSLAPDLQEQILFMEAIDGAQRVTERHLRPIARIPSWAQQRAVWARTIAPLLTPATRGASRGAAGSER
jgi:DNA invertase Pin-like site-specific DNA recombinase